MMQKNSDVSNKPPIGTVLSLVGTTDILLNNRPTSVLAVTEYHDDQSSSPLFVVRFVIMTLSIDWLHIC